MIFLQSAALEKIALSMICAWINHPFKNKTTALYWYKNWKEKELLWCLLSSYKVKGILGATYTESNLYLAALN